MNYIDASASVYSIIDAEQYLHTINLNSYFVNYYPNHSLSLAIEELSSALV